jgi:hypothetical protein
MTGKALWPDVSGHPILREKDPDPTHLRIALRYGIATAQSPEASEKETLRIKGVIERLAEGEPPSEYRNSILQALQERFPRKEKRAWEPRGWDNPAMRE